MRLVDANLLLYAVNVDAPEHAVGRAWLEDQLNGVQRVGLPWESLTAFVRLATNARVVPRPLSEEEALAIVDAWLDAGPTWIPQSTDGHAEIFGGLVRRHRLRGNLISDAHIAAIAIEHGLEVCPADTDFARFTELRWINPLGGHADR